MDLRYTSYLTMFTTGTNFPVPPAFKDRDVCFARAFTSIEYKPRWFRILILDPEKNTPRYNHYCCFTKKQISNHIRLLKSIVDIKYRVHDYKTSDGKYGYLVDCFINSTNKYVQKYVVTWIRYLYEEPYNYFLLEAHRLKSLPAFKFESIANLFIVVASCYSYYNDGHSICLCPSQLLTRSELKDRLQHTKSLNTIYHKKEIKQSHSEYSSNTDDWTIKNFEKNLPLYLEQYTKLK